jgi:hypothetical protein
VEKLSGKVTQIIAPEDQDRYMIPSWFQPMIEEKYHVCIKVRPDAGKLQMVKENLLSILPGKSFEDWNKGLILEEEPEFEEGDFVELEVQPFTAEIPRTYTVKSSELDEEDRGEIL